MEKYIIGIDVGTTGTKAMLFTTRGQTVSRAYQSYPMKASRPGWSEQCADDWWDAVVKTVRSLCGDPETARNVLAISLSLQGGTVVPVDAQMKPLRPAIVWNDCRGREVKDAFLREVGDGRTLYRMTGWGLGESLPLLTVRWLRENEPQLFEKTRMFLTVPDFISRKMTGIPATDLSNAGINQFCDIQKKKYDPRLLAFAGICEDQLPKLVSTGTPIGKLTNTAAQELGLSQDTLLVAGAHDQYAVALGAGAIRSGDIVIGSGTCWVVTAMDDKPDFSSELSQSVAAVPGMWGSLQSLSSGGVCLDWLRRITGNKTYEEIDGGAVERKAAEDGLFFYPFSGKSGDETHFCRASFTGLDPSHDELHLAKAVMEGVAFQIRWMLEDFAVKPSAAGIILAGGASRSVPWVQLTAEILGLPVRVPHTPDLSCVGAAVIAGVGCGCFDSFEEGSRLFTVGERTVMPDPDRSKKYEILFGTYKEQARQLPV